MTTLLGVPVSLLSSIASRHAFLSVYCILGVFQSREAIPESVDAPDRHASQAASQQNLDQSDLSRVRRDEDVVLTGEFELLSLTQASTSANGTSSQCSMSADGSVVVFQSNADNIVSLDENDMPDVFLLDRSENTIRCISLSADVTGQDSRTTANGASGSPSISADGRYVVFHSEATNLVEIDENGCSDVFLYDSKKTSVSSISQSHAGSGGDGTAGAPGYRDQGNG